MTTRRVILGLTLVTLAPACGPDGPGGPGDSFREGEPCAALDAPAECVRDGDDGLEFCVDATGDRVWSACLTETCEAEGDARACAGGKQYCTRHSVEGADDLRWGACTDEAECEPGESRDCGLPPEAGVVSQGCAVSDDGVPRWDSEACVWGTPLVLSFGAEIEFSPAATNAADFAVERAGACARADWPGAATPWLALDRDRSGSIDGGHELFGSGTRLAAGTAGNGFIALAELDSDGDARISANDARWGELVLWADHDGDRRSSAWEMLPLASFDVVAIELSYTNRRECDRAGNCGVERASFVYRAQGRERVGEVVDVHLACE